MSPIPLSENSLPEEFVKGQPVEKPVGIGLVLEAWAQGYLVGSLIILACITLANMRRGVLLHKLILLELILGIWQGFWLFFNSPVHAWWLSVGAIFLNASWSLHNVIAWMKLRPFLSRPVSWIFIGSVILVQPYWVVEIYANFAFFHGYNQTFKKTRPYEALCRDPWWIFTTVALFWTIKKQYELTVRNIIRISPRFAIMLSAMIVSIIFIILDICSVTGAFNMKGTIGINPYWKLAFVFKCLTDAVVLDDFKTALDRLRAFKISRIGSYSQDTSDRRTRNDGNLINTWEELENEAYRRPTPALPSPDGTLVHASHFPGFRLHRKQRGSKDAEKVHKEHKDSIVAPDYIPGDLESRDLQPEDMVPSALENAPMRTMETAHVRPTRPGDWMELESGNDAHLTNESDYAQALREMEGNRLSTTTSKISVPRRPSHPP